MKRILAVLAGAVLMLLCTSCNYDIVTMEYGVPQDDFNTLDVRGEYYQECYDLRDEVRGITDEHEFYKNEKELIAAVQKVVDNHNANGNLKGTIRLFKAEFSIDIEQGKGTVIHTYELRWKEN